MKSYKFNPGILLFFFMIFTFQVRSQVYEDLTIETYGLFGKGRPSGPSSYYFLQATQNNEAKILPASNSTGQIDIEREGNYIYFKLGGTDLYLKFVGPDNLVKWVKGKDINAKWKEIAPVQNNAGTNWKSYVLAKDETLYLRHANYIMYADPKNHPRSKNTVVFTGDATWSIQGGMLVPPENTPNDKAYGRKQIQTYSVVNNVTNNYWIGTDKSSKLKIVDITNASTGTALMLEIRFKLSKNYAIIIDQSTQKFITTDEKGNVYLSVKEEPGSYWEIVGPLKSLAEEGWFSIRSLHPKLANDFYLRHTNYILYVHKDGTIASQYFKGDATWRFVNQ